MVQPAKRTDAESLAPWIARETRFTFLRTEVRYATAHDLFSSAGLDVGSARLLRILQARAGPLFQERGSPVRVLDLGCGAGALGLAIARAMPCGTVEVVQSDRDRLATAVAAHNLRLNDLDPNGPQARVLPAGLGYLPVRAAGEAPFDLIVSNVPAKAGEEGLRALLFGAGDLLRPGGEIAFVHVTPITETIESLRRRFVARGGRLEVVDATTGKEHRALRWRFPEGLPEPTDTDPLEPFRRHDVEPTIRLPGAPRFPYRAVRDVAEFDTPHFRTPLLAKTARDRRSPRPGEERILVLQPQHGFLGALLAHGREPALLHLLGRDTLALRQALLNVESALATWGSAERVAVAAAPAQRARAWLPKPVAEGGDGYDLIVGHLLWKEGPRAHVETLRALLRALRPQGRIVLSVSSGRLDSLKRFAHEAGLRVGRDARRRGQAAVVLAPPRRGREPPRPPG